MFGSDAALGSGNRHGVQEFNPLMFRSDAAAFPGYIVVFVAAEDSAAP
ncbi:hypothetical protein ACFQZO_25360 [Bradyrhizobium sp. GCM10027634]|nr:hypothetical protein [Bradyrhizobium sp. WYCCWR 12677]MDN5004175.1 hypothetical protein [Bradyrhizobium sp. WYCCWR 12677]